MDPQKHWEHVYQSRHSDEVSWFQPEATLSLELIQRVAASHDSHIVDIGAGASTLVDGLIAAGYENLMLLDLSHTALEETKRRLGSAGRSVVCREADVLGARFESSMFDVWHDRAVFHFLTNPPDRARYVDQVQRALRPGGHAIVSTFAEDGPTRCSGLNVARYSANELHSEFGTSFRLLTSYREAHRTPWGATQQFTYCVCRYEPHASSRHAA
jgi:SAM-dependent methyltransferase